MSITQGFEVAHYKDLGSAYATMNVSEMHLPAWLGAMESKELTNDAQALLEEQIHLIQHIRTSKGEEGAEEYELLRFYRDFLSANDLRPFWKFTTTFSGYLMSARHGNRYMPQLTTQGLEQLIMNTQEKNPEAVAILNTPGFQHIADAIRSATVSAQYRRSQQDDRTYEVRYGLGQELMRKARHGKEFTIALADFLFLYNAETAREAEKATNKREPSADTTSTKLRYMTSEDDFKEVVELINQYGSELVGSMLVACGYSFKNYSNNNTEKSRKTPVSNVIA